MPDLIGVLRQLDPLHLLLPFFVEDADLHFGGVSGENGEVGAFSVPACASGVRKAFLHCGHARFSQCFGHDDVCPVLLD